MKSRNRFFYKRVRRTFPKTGIIVILGYNEFFSFGYYQVVDIEKHEDDPIEETFEEIKSSANVMGFLAIVRALKECHERNVDLKVYCYNKCSIIWARKASCKSTFKEPKLEGEIEAAEIFLKEHPELRKQIRFYKKRWIKPTLPKAIFIDADTAEEFCDDDDLCAF